MLSAQTCLRCVEHQQPMLSVQTSLRCTQHQRTYAFSTDVPTLYSAPATYAFSTNMPTLYSAPATYAFRLKFSAQTCLLFFLDGVPGSGCDRRGRPKLFAHRPLDVRLLLVLDLQLRGLDPTQRQVLALHPQSSFRFQSDVPGGSSGYLKSVQFLVT